MTRKEAKEAGFELYFTGARCRNGHISARLTRTARCLDCPEKPKKAKSKNQFDIMISPFENFMNE